MIFGLTLGSWTLAKVESCVGVVSYHRPHAGYRTECRNTAGVWVGRSSLLTHFRSVKNSRLTRVDGRSARVVAGSEGYELALLDVDAVQNNWFTVSDVLPSAGARLTASAAVRGSGLQTKFGTSFLGIYNKGGRYRFDATAPEYLDPEEQFGIVVDEGNRLAGIVCAFDEGDDDIPPTLEIVPSTLIKAFLDQCRAGTSIGPASLPFKLQAATNRSMRKYLNVDEISEGSLVIGRDEPETEEVLLSIAEHKVNADGSLSGRDFEKALVFPDYLASCLSPGDSIAVTMRRDGNTYEQKVQLEPWVARGWYGNQLPSESPWPDFEVVAGLVFTDLSAEYLNEFGESWRLVAPTALMALTGSEQSFAAVVLSEVLPDESTVGYLGIRHSVLDTVNETKVSSLAELRRSLQVVPDSFTTFRLLNGLQIVMDTNSLDSSTRRVLKAYNLRSARRE